MYIRVHCVLQSYGFRHTWNALCPSYSILWSQCLSPGASTLQGAPRQEPLWAKLRKQFLSSGQRRAGLRHKEGYHWPLREVIQRGVRHSLKQVRRCPRLPARGPYPSTCCPVCLGYWKGCRYSHGVIGGCPAAPGINWCTAVAEELAFSGPD